MFYLKIITQHITIPPHELSNRLYEFIKTRLDSNIGKCSITHGYIITIFNILDIDGGFVGGDGSSIFRVKFKALVFKPIRD